LNHYDVCVAWDWFVIFEKAVIISKLLDDLALW